jgi:hypothetical protein
MTELGAGNTDQTNQGKRKRTHAWWQVESTKPREHAWRQVESTQQERKQQPTGRKIICLAGRKALHR